MKILQSSDLSKENLFQRNKIEKKHHIYISQKINLFLRNEIDHILIKIITNQFLVE